MDVYLARQPIFDIHNKVYGYEILYRDGHKPDFAEGNGDYASGNVLTRCFLDFGIDEIAQNHMAFINFTADLIKSNVATIFPKEHLVIEILENIAVDDDIIGSCIQLKEMGYRIAIDDFTFQPGYERLIPLVDFIKVDFTITPPQERAGIIRAYGRRGLSFLAEKVETHEEYNQAVAMGFTYFQGYYFAKPEITAKRKVIPYNHNRVSLISKINEPEPDFKEITRIIENDFAFSYEILRLVNSAFYGLKKKITSIQHAVVILGINELKKWVYLVFLRDLKHDRPDEIVNVCMFRGKFMENLALCTQSSLLNSADKVELSSQLLTLGMFSLIDVLTNKPIEEALAEMNFSNEIMATLSHGDTASQTSRYYELCLSYERGEWESIGPLARELAIPESKLNDAYRDSLAWLRDIDAV